MRSFFTLLAASSREAALTAARGKRIPITRRALLQRINRKLAKRTIPQKIETSRSGGFFFLIDLTRNEVMETNVKIERLGRDLGVLKAWEAPEIKG